MSEMSSAPSSSPSANANINSSSSGSVAQPLGQNRNLNSSDNKSSSNNNSSNPIRHSGKALVRGKFRRVWRPRRLEVLDNGVVNYYELNETLTPTTTAAGRVASLDSFFVDSNTTSTTKATATSTTTNEEEKEQTVVDNDDYHSKIPKASLWIHHARIIDVTTLRDMHVGLPRGSFGFLFNGHPVSLDEDDDILYDGTDKYNHSMNPQTQLLGFTNLGQSMMGGVSPYQACQGGGPSPQSTARDFLCAVSTLEEAQSWVIALQWAASMGRESSFHWNTLSASIASSAATSNNDFSSEIPRNDSYDVVTIAHPTLSDGTLELPQKEGTSTAKTAPAAMTNNKPVKQSTPTNKRKCRATIAATYTGKMVVTKAVSYQLVRLDYATWEIAYQIKVLLVLPSSPSSSEPRQVQEWMVVRTAHDLASLLKPDTTTVASSPSSTQDKRQQYLVRIGDLPKIQPPASRTKEKQQRSVCDLPKALSTVDSILRFVCINATLVNSAAAKRFLGLLQPNPCYHTTKDNSHNQLFWKYHDDTAIATPRKRTILKQNMDEYVKQWLQLSVPAPASTSSETTKAPYQETKVSLRFQVLCWYLRLPQPTTTYAGIVLLSTWVSITTLPLLNRFIRRYQVLPFVTIRADALVFSWFVAAGLGHLHALYNNNSSNDNCSRNVPTNTQSHQPTAALSTTKKEQERPTVLTSTKKCTALHPNKSLIDSDDDADSRDDVSSLDVENDEEEEDGEENFEEVNVATTTLSPKKRHSSGYVLDHQDSRLNSPLPEYNRSKRTTTTCWSKPADHIFNVRGPTYLNDRVKIPSANASFTCQGVDMWMTDNPERHIARHPSVLGGRLANAKDDTFLVNFLLTFGNFVSYFSVPPLDQFASPQLAGVWSRFIQGDQQYRDARLKLLPVVVDGPWIVRAAVPGNSPALLGKAIPLQYFFTEKENGRNVYEVDVIITASSIAKGILSVVKGHSKALSIAFAFIIEAAEEKELPETALASFQVHAINLEDCPLLPDAEVMRQ